MNPAITVALFLFFCVSTVQAADNAPVPSSKAQGPGLLSHSRDRLSQGIVRVADRLDRFFASSRYQQEVNGTELRLGAYSQYDHNGVLRHGTRSRLHLDLPSTNRRFQLVIGANQGSTQAPQQSGPDFIDELADGDDEEGVDEDEDFESGPPSGVLSAALQYILQSNEKWDARAKTGLLFDIPDVDPFSELHIRRNIPLRRWNLRITDNLRWSLADQWINRLKFEPEYGLTDKTLFRSSTYATWRQLDPVRTLGQDFSLNYVKNIHQAYSYSAGVQDRLSITGATQWQRHHFYINIRFRHMVYRNWIFYEVLAYLNAPSEHHYARQPGMLFSLDFLFNARSSS